MDTVALIVSIVVAIFGSTGFWSWLSNRNRKKSDESRIIMGIAYRSIKQQAEYHIKKGYIEPEEFKELETYLFIPYRNMGGNGSAERMIEEVKRLPFEKP